MYAHDQNYAANLRTYQYNHLEVLFEVSNYSVVN